MISHHQPVRKSQGEKGFALIPLLIILILAGAAGWWVWDKKFTPSVSANWKTYQNEQYNFELRYPINLIPSRGISEHGGFFYVAFGIPSEVDSEPVVTIRVYQNQTTLEKFIGYFDYLKANWENTRVGDMAAKKTMAIGQNSKQFILVAMVYNGNGYEIASTLYGDSMANIDITNQILSTFKFLK